MKKLGLAVLLLGGLLLVAACQPAAEEPAAEEPAKEEPSAASSQSIARGGLLYDKWWKVAEGASEPSTDHPLWSLQSSNTRSGADTWRCKECHGWDYQGKDGAYASGSHMTGFTGVYGAGAARTAADLLAALKGGDNAQHDFSTVMGDEALQDIANFLSKGLIDDKSYIDYSTKKVIGADLANGQKLYDNTCAVCHGSDGWMIDFGDEGVGNLANGNPWETLHKIRFGQPGTAMPSALGQGWSTKDAVDVLGYAQTLPEEPPSSTGLPPNIPHPLEGRDDCLMCHETGLGDAPQYPADHAGRTSDMCRACHQPAS